MASSETLLAASSALNSLLARRQKQKQKQKSQAAGTVVKRIPSTPSSKNKNKKARTSTPKIISEGEEARRLKEAEEKKVEANVKILKELGKSGKKEKMAMDEIVRLRKEKELARKGKGKKPEPMNMDEGDESD